MQDIHVYEGYHVIQAVLSILPIKKCFEHSYPNVLGLELGIVYNLFIRVWVNFNYA